MDKHKLDGHQLELDLTQPLEPNSHLVETFPTGCKATAPVYDFRPRMLLMQANARKSKAEKVLRAAGIIR